MSEQRKPQTRQYGVSRSLAAAMRRTTPEEWAEEMRLNIATRMAEIADMFLPGAKVTVLVRRPQDDRADICVSDDEYSDMIALIRRCEARDAEAL